MVGKTFAKVRRDERGGLLLSLSDDLLRGYLSGEALRGTAAELGVSPQCVEPILRVYWRVVFRVLCENKEIELPIGHIWIGRADQYAKKIWAAGQHGTPFYAASALLNRILRNVFRMERAEVDHVSKTR